MPETFGHLLAAGERVLWTGRPEKGLRSTLSTKSIRVVLGGALLFMFAYIIGYSWVITPENETAKLVIGYWLSWLMALYLLRLVIFPVQVRYKFLRRSRHYALTNKRAIILGNDNTLLQAWSLQSDSEPWQEPDALFFGLQKETKKTPHYTGISGRKFSKFSGFEMIPDAQAVYELAIKTIANLK